MKLTLNELRTLRSVTYIGDGVYVGLRSDDSVVLATSDGVSVTNEVYLDPSVLDLFDEWRKIRVVGRERKQ